VSSGVRAGILLWVFETLRIDLRGMYLKLVSEVRDGFAINEITPQNRNLLLRRQKLPL
jgi:hypothetical protein